ncbi:MAG: hypothetical protein JXB32_16350 [Deltaproteobacteria bacterium]|nr:hypothetical protein [Deltaproteobacteria bacterium]
MPKPMSVCLEQLDRGDDRFLRCVAVPGRGPGLRLDADGAVRWREDGAHCELWVSTDERLILFRPAGGPPATVSRAGRSVEAPEEKPVVLLGGDEIRIGARTFRVHLHGPTQVLAAPEPFQPRVERGRLRAAAAAVALGTAVAAAGCGGGTPTGTTTPGDPEDASVEPQEPDSGEPIEVRYQPPAPPMEYPSPEPPDEPEGPAEE